MRQPIPTFAVLAASLLAGPALYAQDPEPQPPVPPTPPPVSVSITGPTNVAAGDFVVVAIGSVSEGAESTWGYDPDPGPEHRAVFVEPTTGRQLVVFIQAPAGVYHLTLVGQKVTEGKDPTDAATKMVTVGKPKPPGPQPDPDNPDPPPGPDLTGLAKQVYERAKAVNDKEGAARLAENYEATLSAIAAGAYAGEFRTAKGKIIADLYAANEPVTTERPAWDAFFADARGWMNGLESSGQLNTLDAVSARLGDIRTGLSEAAK